MPKKKGAVIHKLSAKVRLLESDVREEHKSSKMPNKESPVKHKSSAKDKSLKSNSDVSGEDKQLLKTPNKKIQVKRKSSAKDKSSESDISEGDKKSSNTPNKKSQFKRKSIAKDKSLESDVSGEDKESYKTPSKNDSIKRKFTARVMSNSISRDGMQKSLNKKKKFEDSPRNKKKVKSGAEATVSMRRRSVKEVKYAPNENVPIPIQKTKKAACKECGTRFKTDLQLNNHVRTVHSSFFKQCAICSERIKNLGKYYYHMILYHPEVERYPCDYSKCLQSFHTLKKLRDHKKTHFRYVCQYCKKICSLKFVMLAHVQKEHL